MIEVNPSHLSPHVTLGLLAIEQVGYVVLVCFLAMVLRDDFAQIRRETYRATLWTALGALAFSGLLFIFLSGLGAEMAPFAVSFAAAFVLGAMNPVFALCFFMISLLLRPWELMPESDVMLILPKALFFLSLASALLHSVRKSQYSWIMGREGWTLLAFTGWVYLTIFHSPNWMEGHQDFVDHFSRTIIIFFLMVNLVKTRLEIFAVSASLTGACGVIAALTAYRMLFDPALQGTHSRAELFGLIGDPNDISAVLLMALPFALFFVTRQLTSKLPRLVAASIISGVTVWLVTLTQSRGAMVALVILVSVYVWTETKTRVQRAFFLVLILVGMAGLQGTIRRTQSDLEASQSGRLSYWKAGIKMAVRNPIFGVGYQAFPVRLPEYVDGRFSEAGPRTAHSTWILLLAETGIVGLGLFATLFGWAFQAALRVFHRYPYLFFSLVGYGASITFLSHSYMLHPYLLMAIVFTAERIERVAVPSL